MSQTKIIYIFKCHELKYAILVPNKYTVYIDRPKNLLKGLYFRIRDQEGNDFTRKTNPGAYF